MHAYVTVSLLQWLTCQCACSVRVLCDVTASNTRDSYTDGEHCAPGTPALTVRDARCTLHTASHGLYAGDCV